MSVSEMQDQRAMRTTSSVSTSTDETLALLSSSPSGVDTCIKMHEQGLACGSAAIYCCVMT